MCAMKTPGVYIVEKNAFPNSVVEAATAVPAFIGYTEKAKNGSKPLTNVPFKISSLAEFEQYFGGAPKPKFTISKGTDETSSIYIDKSTIKVSISFLLGQVSSLKKSINDLDKLNEKTPKNDALIASKSEKLNAAIESFKAKYNAFVESFDAVYGKDGKDFSSLLGELKTLVEGEYDAEKMAEIETKFNEVLLAIDGTVTPVYYDLKREDKYNMYYQLRFFFANGGGSCYIVSVGNYEGGIEKDKLENGVSFLLLEQEPTMVLTPEAVYLESAQDCYDVQTTVLKHCGGDMRNRVAILDVYNGYLDRQDPSGDVVTEFREKIGTEFLDYGAVYYPWLHTSVIGESEVSFQNLISSWDEVKNILLIHSIYLKEYVDALDTIVDAINNNKYVDPNNVNTIHKVFSKQSGIYASLNKEMLQILNMLPPSTAMAGIYTLVDGTKEVWKAPANIGVSNVISPTVNISHLNQEDLNVPLNGKSVNAIRFFPGDGVKVWGARTLDGNSLDWRYINVRRTMIMLEESIKNATKAFVFEPNTANTWVSVRSMISNFLNGIWKRGGLAGAVPEDAFSVHIGLGETMTPEDILEGIMRITVLVAVVRPAEFIEITFQQQMQKS